MGRIDKETTMNEMFVLGAPDPEMEAIERLLRDFGVKFAFAAVLGRDGKPTRVTPREAYAPTHVIVDGAGVEVDALLRGRLDEHMVFVECDLPGAPAGAPAGVLRMDHHRPGDPGYGLGPVEFLRASSIGQVITWLAKQGRLTEMCWGWEPKPYRLPPRTREDIGRFGAASYGACVIGCGGGTHVVPPEIVLTAAADHCLSAAYAGKCPGVDPAALDAFRVRQRAEWLARGPGSGRDAARAEVARAFFGRAIDMCAMGAHGEVDRWAIALRGARYATKKVIEHAPRVMLGGVAVIDLRSVGTLPELPTVLAETGQCALYRMVPPPEARDQRVKVGVIGAGEGSEVGTAPIDEFLGGWAAERGLVDLYGDPARGFAGGYEPAP
jgi:hypothetical protein